MGSLSSRPKVPAGPQTIFVSQPVQSEAVTDVSSLSERDALSGTNATEARTQSLLRRNRGRTGTIQTSFRGLLGLANTESSRKTLLGE